MKLFSVAISPNRTDCIATNDTQQHGYDDTKKICAIRWYVDQFHRELKQLTGVEKIAYKTPKTVYKIKHEMLKNYLIKELAEPSLKMSFS